jgi:hypothetical protein
MTATDFYLLADQDDTFRRVELWRVPLAGGSPSMVTTVYGYSRFEVGATIAAFTDGVEHGVVVDLATGEELEVLLSDRHYGMRLEIVGDSGFVSTGSYSQQGAERVDRFHPSGAVFTDPLTDATWLDMFSDDRYVYVTRRKGLPPATPWEPLSITAFDPVTLQQHAYATCLEFTSDYDVVFDETNLYGVQKGSGSNYDIVIAPRAPLTRIVVPVR